jgi:hypothetical protein
VIGTGADGRLPVADDVTSEAVERGVELTIAPTADAIERLRDEAPDTNAILHVTC